MMFDMQVMRPKSLCLILISLAHKLTLQLTRFARRVRLPI